MMCVCLLIVLGLPMTDTRTCPSTLDLYPPRTKFRGVYRNHSVRLSVRLCANTQFFVTLFSVTVIPAS